MNDRPEAALVAFCQILRAIEFNSRSIARASDLTPHKLLFIYSRLQVTPIEIAFNAPLKQAIVTALFDRHEAKTIIKRVKTLWTEGASLLRLWCVEMRR